MLKEILLGFTTIDKDWIYARLENKLLQVFAFHLFPVAHRADSILKMEQE
jgi:hypothetical protein